MRGVKVSIKVLKWVVAVFIKASKVHRRTVKRWNLKDHFAEFYCTLKYNESGRYISFIALQGQNKSVIIIPESTPKGGWGNIAHKIAGFIYEPIKTQGTTVKDRKQLHKSYKEALFQDRWMTEATEKAEIQSTANKVRITGGESQPVNDLLNRCIVGKFQCQADETPILNDVRRWACNSWKLAIQVKVYAMNDGYFMFELPSKVAAEQVLTDIINIEISANKAKENKFQRQITQWSRDRGELEVARQSVEMAVTDREELGEKSITVMFQPLEEENLDGDTEEAIPLGIQFPEEDMSTSDWIQQNITKLSSEFGVNFKGCEEKAKELLMKIDSNKQGNRGEQSKQTTGKRKGLLELKRLQLDSKFYSNGTRSKGGVLAIMDQ
uniref:DUF4283 domain-containing protein n=1 Tax=Solanum tuberosum TaxID=4113 RepID=M0ZV41_SOLTU